MSLRKILSLILAVILTMGICPAAFAVGDIPSGYTPIYTEEDLNNIRNNLSGKYILMNDIDLSTYENWLPIGDMENSFTGIFLGNGMSVNNLKIDALDDIANHTGLFGVVSNAIITDVSIENAIISISINETNIGVGVLAGMARNSDITRCSTSGKISVVSSDNMSVGGIIGYNCGRLILCHSNTDIEVLCKKGLANIGGVAGTSDSTVLGLGYVTKSKNEGNISVNAKESEGTGFVCAGGIVGSTLEEVSDCYNKGEISVYSEVYSYVGGIVGESASIYNSYNVGKLTVSGNSELIDWGGISGYTYPVTVIIGDEDFDNNRNSLVNCYYSDCIPMATFPESDLTMINVKALTTEEMKNQTSFAGFDFKDTWYIENGMTPDILISNYAFAKELSMKSKEKQPVSKKPINIIWSESTNETVATIDNEGNINAIDNGTTTVSFITSNGQVSSCKITVKNTFIGERIVELLKNAINFLFKWIMKI